MTDSGHVFVVRGRIEHLDYDALILPTDVRFSVTQKWEPALGHAFSEAARGKWAEATKEMRPPDWTARGWGQAVPPRDVQLARPTWFVDAVLYGADARADLQRMLMNVDAALRDIARSRLGTTSGRPRPLVAVPTLGVGAGGFDSVRGDVVDGLVRVCQEVVTEETIDVVIVAFAASDHAAFQARRREIGAGHELHLGARALRSARDIAERAKEGSLALFLGAGVSMSAGLPSWNRLLALVAASAGVNLPDERELGPLDRAELLRIAARGKLGHLVAEHTTGDRYGLTHALIASFGCEQAVTTNYDHLYEDAARDGDARVLPVLPFETAVPKEPWLLKMHGDVDHPKTIVLTRSDFVGYDATSRPMGSVLQTLLLTKHLLVVGASLSDDNFLRLAHEVMAFQDRGGARRGRFGTVVTMKPEPVKGRLWKGRFTFVSTSPRAKVEDGTTARRLAIFLDAVAMYAARPAHLADERYEFLLAHSDLPIAQQARDLAALIRHRGADGPDPWADVLSALEDVGALPPTKAHP